MGWRLRKSLNLGLGFRINLSKTGIGYSWGVPGYRLTKMANGANRTTYSVPGTGISYVEQSGSGKGKNQTQINNLYTGEVENYINIPDEDMQKEDPILNKINKALSLNRWSNILMFSIAFVHWVPFFWGLFIFGIIIKAVIATKMKIKLYYEFDKESRIMYDSLKEIFIILSNNRKIWQINSSTKVFNEKYNAGAKSGVERNNAFITNKMPWFIRTNLSVYGLSLKNEKMFFTPDRIIVFRPFKKAFGCTYNDTLFEISTTRFVESEQVYSDVEVIDYTWSYVNNDGGRDLRFSNNRKIPVCRYGELSIKSPNGINTVLNFSNNNLCYDIQKNLIMFGNKFNKILDQTKMIQKDKPDERTTEIKKMDISHKNVPTGKKDDVNINKATEIVKQSDNVKKEMDYKLPSISLLKDIESKSIKPFLEIMKAKNELLIPIGTSNKKCILESISTMPNMLVGGTVMSGKTTYISTVITSILLTKKPSEVRLIIFDSKRADYSMFNSIPHMLLPINYDYKKFEIVLKKMCLEIEHRQDILRENNCKNIDIYNKKEGMKTIPDYIIIIDDFATFNNNNEINSSIEYITSNGWNTNVYIIIACNHPSAAVIPTVSKAKFPARLSFKVTSLKDSQIVIDEPGAEKLSGYGNALYISRMNDKVLKVKVPIITDSDIFNVVDYCSKQSELASQVESISFQSNKNESDDYNDPVYDDVVEFAIKTGKISVALIQRKFRLGYNRAARIIDLLEEKGIVGPQDGDKPREVLIKLESDGE